MVANGSYGGIRSKHPTLAARAALEAARRASVATYYDEEEEEAEASDSEPPLNFAQKLLLGENILMVGLTASQRREHFQHQRSLGLCSGRTGYCGIRG